MTSTNREVVVDGVVVNDEYAKNVLLKLINDRDNVELKEVMNFLQWCIRVEKCNERYSEDCAVVIESWLQENDILISDEFAYYRDMMEAPTSR